MGALARFWPWIWLESQFTFFRVRKVLRKCRNSRTCPISQPCTMNLTSEADVEPTKGASNHKSKRRTTQYEDQRRLRGPRTSSRMQWRKGSWARERIYILPEPPLWGPWATPRWQNRHSFNFNDRQLLKRYKESLESMKGQCDGLRADYNESCTKMHQHRASQAMLRNLCLTGEVVGSDTLREGEGILIITARD